MPILGAPMASNPMPPMSSIVGSTDVDQGMRKEANIREEIRAVMRQAREITMQIDGIAQQFPIAAEHLDSAKKALMESMKAIIANQAGPEAMAPISVG